MVFNGRVAAAESFPDGCASGSLEADVPAASDGWIAARLWSRARDSFAQPVFAHTSPVYVVTGQAGPEKRAAAAYFDDGIERSIEWASSKGKFYTDNQRREVVDLFREGQQVYKRALGG